MSKTHETNQQAENAKPVQANAENETQSPEIGGKPSHARILKLQRTVGNQAVQRIVSEESAGQGSVQRRWDPPFLGDRIRSFADSAQSSDQTYDWFNVEARNWEGGQSFMDSVPPPGTAARGTIQPPGGSTGGGDTIPTEE